MSVDQEIAQAAEINELTTKERPAGSSAKWAQTTQQAEVWSKEPFRPMYIGAWEWRWPKRDMHPAPGGSSGKTKVRRRGGGHAGRARW